VPLDTPDRALEADETQVFTVSVTVPRGAPAGAFSLRLDVIDRDDPDEVGTTGQVVTVRVPGTPPAPVAPSRRGYLAALVGTVAGSAVLGGIAFALSAAALHGGDDLADAIGNVLGIAFFTMLGSYVGACVGCGVALKVRRHTRPWLTAAVEAVALPVCAVVVATVTNMAHLGDWLFYPVGAVIVAAPPLLSRFAVLRGRPAAAH
jgi:hypothetical protein